MEEFKMKIYFQKTLQNICQTFAKSFEPKPTLEIKLTVLSCIM